MSPQGRREDGESTVKTTKLINSFNHLYGGRGSLLPDEAGAVKGVFVAMPQIERNSATHAAPTPQTSDWLARLIERVFGNGLGKNRGKKPREDRK
jgi:hypothetical protein